MNFKNSLLMTLILLSTSAFAQDQNPFLTSVYKFNYALTDDHTPKLDAVFLGTTEESQKALSAYLTLLESVNNTYVLRHESIYLIQVCGLKGLKAGITSAHKYKSIEVSVDETAENSELIEAMKNAASIVAKDILDVPDRYQNHDCRGALIETGQGSGEYRKVVITYQDDSSGAQSIPLSLIYPPLSE